MVPLSRTQRYGHQRPFDCRGLTGLNPMRLHLRTFHVSKYPALAVLLLGGQGALPVQSPDARARDIELAGQVVVPANEVHHE